MLVVPVGPYLAGGTGWLAATRTTAGEEDRRVPSRPA
jgi:hypothetical protein